MKRINKIAMMIAMAAPLALAGCGGGGSKPGPGPGPGPGPSQKGSVTIYNSGVVASQADKAHKS
jgi:hypothetical protein